MGRRRRGEGTPYLAGFHQRFEIFLQLRRRLGIHALHRSVQFRSTYARPAEIAEQIQVVILGICWILVITRSLMGPRAPCGARAGPLPAPRPAGATTPGVN